MDIQLTFTDCTLSTEQQAVVNAVNKFLAPLPADQDPEAAQRLALEFLEAADVAPQASLVRAMGLHQTRSLRYYKQRLRAHELAGLFDRPIPGRPAVTTSAPVEQAVLQVIMAAVMTVHRLPSDAEVAAQVRQVLAASQTAVADQVTPAMIATIRRRWGIQRSPTPPAACVPPSPTPTAPVAPAALPPAPEAAIADPVPPALPSAVALVAPAAPAVASQTPPAACLPPSQTPSAPVAPAALPPAPEPDAAAPTALPPAVPLAAAIAPTAANQTPPAAAPPVPSVRLGQTRIGGAFILAILLVEAGWLKLAHLLPMAPHYAVSATQWLLTALFAVIFEAPRASHLDDVCDIGFALVTGRPRPLSHSTFQHLLWAIPGAAAQQFYAASAAHVVQATDAATRRISLDGHNLPRYTRLVPVSKGKIGNTGRILPAEELELAFDPSASLRAGSGCPLLVGATRLSRRQEADPRFAGARDRTAQAPRTAAAPPAPLLRQGRLPGRHLPRLGRPT
jgi:hypothetical protein